MLIYGWMTHMSLGVPSLSVFIGLYCVAFAVYALNVFWVLRKPVEDAGKVLGVILVFAVLFRLIALPGIPLFEDDMHRYLWDGKVWASGINPYFYPPDDFFVEHLRDENWVGINFKFVPTIYPPLAQFIFKGAYLLAPNSAVFLKSVFFLFDCGIIGGLVWLLKRRNLPISHVVIYAWNPLIIKEFANSGHLDVVCVFFVVLFCAFVLKDNRVLAAAALGLAILSKLYPLVLLPALLRYFRVRDFAMCLGVVLLGYFLFWDAEELVFEGLGTYAKHWEFNDSGFLGLHSLLALFTDSSYVVAKVLVILGLGGLGLHLASKMQREGADVLYICFVMFGGLLLFSPTVDTWYLTWILPFLCFFPRISWLLLSGTCIMAYCYFWQDRDFWWMRVVEYAPFYVYLVLEYTSESFSRVLFSSKDSHDETCE